jgi:methyl coenzyme M reductase subunit C
MWNVAAGHNDIFATAKVVNMAVSKSINELIKWQCHIQYSLKETEISTRKYI